MSTTLSLSYHHHTTPLQTIESPGSILEVCLLTHTRTHQHLKPLTSTIISPLHTLNPRPSQTPYSYGSNHLSLSRVTATICNTCSSIRHHRVRTYCKPASYLGQVRQYRTHINVRHVQLGVLNIPYFRISSHAAIHNGKEKKNNGAANKLLTCACGRLFLDIPRSNF